MNKELLTAKQKKNLRTLESNERFYTRKIDEILYFKKTNPLIEFEEELRINAVLKELKAKRAAICEKIDSIFTEASIYKV